MIRCGFINSTKNLTCIRSNARSSFAFEPRNVSTSSKSMDLLKPPKEVRGMKQVDKTQFNKKITVPRIKLSNCVTLSTVLPHLKKYLLKMERLTAISNQDDAVTVMLNPSRVQIWDDIDKDNREALGKSSVTEANFEKHELTLTYENFSAEAILRSVLPADQEGMSSFTRMGHIVHVNLREHLLEYKQLIGQVLLDKVSGCRSVINKTNEIDNAYRNFRMEILSGEHDTLTEVKQNGCRFAFDFATVYWNSRLSTEHERVVGKIGADDVLFDVFAGVGPFSIPSAKKGCLVFANDLNPESYKWLNRNSVLNKVKAESLTTYNKDGRDFIEQDVKPILLRNVNKRNVHVVMNLPASAVEFLSGLLGLYDRDELGEVTNPPIVYVYCFAKGEDFMGITRDLIFKSVGRDISDKIVDIFRVRTVSSLKEMMRVTIKLDDELLVKKCSVKRKCDDTDFVMCKKAV